MRFTVEVSYIGHIWNIEPNSYYSICSSQLLCLCSFTFMELLLTPSRIQLNKVFLLKIIHTHGCDVAFYANCFIAVYAYSFIWFMLLITVWINYCLVPSYQVPLDTWMDDILFNRNCMIVDYEDTWKYIYLLIVMWQWNVHA